MRIDVKTSSSEHLVWHLFASTHVVLLFVLPWFEDTIHQLLFQKQTVVHYELYVRNSCYGMHMWHNLSLDFAESDMILIDLEIAMLQTFKHIFPLLCLGLAVVTLVRGKGCPA